jgi:hypothetical protein
MHTAGSPLDYSADDSLRAWCHHHRTHNDVLQCPSNCRPSSGCPYFVQTRNNDNDTATFIKGLRAGEYDALVLDSAVLEYVSASNKDCDLFIVGPTFLTFSLGLAFPGDFDKALVHSFSEAIIMAEVRGSINQSRCCCYCQSLSVTAEAVLTCLLDPRGGGGGDGTSGGVAGLRLQDVLGGVVDEHDWSW